MTQSMLTFPHFDPLFPAEDWVLHRILERQAHDNGSRPFLQWTDAGQPLTFAEVNRRVNRLAHGFTARGVSKGDRVAIFLPNCLEYILVWFALNKLGAIEVTIGDSLRGTFLRHPMALSRTRLVVISHAMISRLAEVESELPELAHAIVWNDPDDNAPCGRLQRISVSPFADLATTRDDDPGVDVHPRDTAAVLFTSGTTGPSKAVSMPHSQLYFFAEELIQVVRLRATDVYLTAFPFFHANAQLESVYPALIVGIRCVLYRKFSSSDWLGRVRRSGATVTNCLGATMAFIASQPEAANDRQHVLRCIFAAPAPENLCALFKQRFGIEAIVTGYGQTEISMPFLSPWGVPIPTGACGMLLDQWFELTLIDAQTQGAIEGPGTGELWVRHKVPGTISDGFLDMPEQTVEAWRDLWFHTGDAMRRDAQGWFYFVDRLKDTLRRRGENISSFEVEEVIRSHPDVTECAVVAVAADEDGGEDEVMACIVLADGAAVEPAALIAYCEPRMPTYAVPRYIDFLSALPKTASEKIIKLELRKRGVTPSTWDRLAASRRRGLR